MNKKDANLICSGGVKKKLASCKLAKFECDFTNSTTDEKNFEASQINWFFF